MIGWLSLGRLAWRMLTGTATGGLTDITDRLGQLAVDLQEARSAVEQAEIEKEIVRLRLLQDTQKPQATRWWSPMQLGQYLIVLPFGVWWATIFLVSVIKPLVVEGRWTVDNVPPHIWEMSWWVIPSIILAAHFERGRK